VPNDATDDVGDLIDGRYRLLGSVSSDEHKGVHRAEDTRTGEQVLLDLFVHRTNDAARADQFFCDATLLSKLDHPGLVSPIDFGVHRDHPYLVRREREGTTLSNLLTHETLAGDAAISLLHGITEALAYAHAREVAHGSLSARTVLISSDGRPHLLELGYRGLIDVDEIDPKEDLAALGSIAHHVIYGSPAPEASAAMARESPQSSSPVFSIFDRLLARGSSEPCATVEEVLKLIERAQPLVWSKEAEAVELTSGAILSSIAVDGPPERDLSAILNLPDLSSSADLPLHRPLVEQSVRERRKTRRREKGAKGMLQRHGATIKAALAGIYLVALMCSVSYYACGLPNAARDARIYVRAGQAMHVVEQLERYTKASKPDPRLQAARGYALLYAKKPKDAARELCAAANNDATALDQADIAALTVLLGIPDTSSLDVEHALSLLPQPPNARLRQLFETTHERFLRCRLAELLSKLGDSTDPASVCIEALDTQECAVKKMTLKRLGERGDQRARPRIEQIAREPNLSFDDDCGQKEAAEALANLEARPPTR
jgi:hypothetical protein